MKVYLDDCRTTPEGWVRTYTVKETIEKLKTGKVRELSLDNDLGTGLEEGYKVMDWLEQHCFENQDFQVPRLFFHTDNATRKAYMKQVAYKILERRR